MTEALSRYLGLVWAMSRKNFKVRYKRAALGMLWALLQPAFQAAVLSFVFLKILHVQAVPKYPLYVLSGILPWSFFASSVIAATTSVVDNASLVKKVALPLSVFPVSAAGGTALAFSASLTVLVGVSVFFGSFGLGILLLPVALAIELLVIIGVALIAGSFHVAFRDVRYVVESAMVVGVYASPILYDLSRVPAGLRPFIRLNPLTGVLSLTRAAVLGRPVDGAAVLCAVGVAAVLLAAGALLFRRRSGEFADLV
ncbi:MAG TPA: ABC transporter permease [Mycobacteriales bacterium]